MFITEEDYRVVIGENALKVVSQASQEIRDNAELEACEEIAGYLRPKYDTEAVFSAEGEGRNRLVVMYAADIALYHMIAAMPQKGGPDILCGEIQHACRGATQCTAYAPDWSGR